jgi:hypothetical protein
MPRTVGAEQMLRQRGLADLPRATEQNHLVAQILLDGPREVSGDRDWHGMAKAVGDLDLTRKYS